MELGLAWECSCGHTVFADEAPEECQKCGNLDSFMQLPEDVLKSREEDSFDDIDVEPVKAKKSKPLKAAKSSKSGKAKRSKK